MPFVAGVSRAVCRSFPRMPDTDVRTETPPLWDGGVVRVSADVCARQSAESRLCRAERPARSVPPPRVVLDLLLDALARAPRLRAAHARKPVFGSTRPDAKNTAANSRAH